MIKMMAPSETSLLALTTAAAFVAFATWWWRYRSKKQENNEPPTSWHPIGEISAITLYPLKSGCGLTLEEAECTDLGLQCSFTGLKLRDRFFIIHDERTGEFKTARTYPKMVLIKLTADKNNMMVLEAPEMPLVKFRPPETVKDARVTMCKMWNAEMVKTADCGHEVASWLSQYILGKESGVRLGYFLDSSFVRRSLKWLVNKCTSLEGPTLAGADLQECSTPTVIDWAPLTAEEVGQAICITKTKKAAGPDGILDSLQ